LDDFGTFLKQVPIGLVIAPVFFGVLYLILMGIIIQRGAARRRKRREEKEQMMAAMQQQPGYSTQKVVAPPAPAAPKQNIIAKNLPRPAPKAAIPEPDLDLLVMPPTFNEITEAPSLSLDSPDWMSALAFPPEQVVETDMNKPTSDPADAVEVMRVWRDLSDGTLIIQMGDRRYRSVAEIGGNPDLVRRFGAVVRELWNMVNSNGAPRPAAVPPPPPESGTLPAPEGSVGMKARIGLLKEQPPAEEPPRPNVLRQIGRTVSGQNPAPPRMEPIGTGGIADAVEEFLQYKLTGHPEFSHRSIHIRPSIDGGVRIEVDGNSYQGIGDVVDPDVREFLFSVMKEWEARQ